MKATQDQSQRELEFSMSDWVWLCLHHRSASGITPSNPSKLVPRFYGPFQITARIGAVAYHLSLPANAKIHDVFHVGLLKKFVGTPPLDIVQLPPVVRSRVVPTPQHVIRARLNRGVWELLIHWQGSDPGEATWESLPSFVATHPDFQLEDALFLGEGGNVIDAFVGKVYCRRKHPGEKKGPMSPN